MFDDDRDFDRFRIFFITRSVENDNWIKLDSIPLHIHPDYEEIIEQLYGDIDLEPTEEVKVRNKSEYPPKKKTRNKSHSEEPYRTEEIL